MRRRALIAGLGAAAALAGLPDGARAQPMEAAAPPAIRTVNQSQLYAESRFAARVLGQLEAHAAAVRTDNMRLQAALEAEEQALTARRAELTPEAFRPLALAFDEKVVRLREDQLRHQRALEAWEEAELRRFFEAARPVLLDLMAQEDAAVLLDERSVVLARPELDLTEAAVARIDAVLGDGAAGAGPLPDPPAMPDGDAAEAPAANRP